MNISQAVEGSPTTESTMRGVSGNGFPASGVGASAGMASVRPVAGHWGLARYS